MEKMNELAVEILGDHCGENRVRNSEAKALCPHTKHTQTLNLARPGRLNLQTPFMSIPRLSLPITAVQQILSLVWFFIGNTEMPPKTAVGLFDLKDRAKQG
jgi:hypothetical protein